MRPRSAELYFATRSGAIMPQLSRNLFQGLDSASPQPLHRPAANCAFIRIESSEKAA